MGLVAYAQRAYLWGASTPRARRVMYAAIFAAIVAPPLLLSVDAYRRVHHDATHMVLARRRAVAQLGALVVQERLDHLTALGRAFANRVRFGELVAAGRWWDAIAILADGPRDFRNVERIFLADLDGVERADTPALPGGVGVNFSHRDWYRGVTSTWEPYVSEPYQRLAEPRYYIVAVAVPIERAGARVGILVIQVKLDSFRDWSRDIALERGGLVYFVGRQGHAIAHPDLPARQGLVDLSAVPAVRRVLRGERGVLVDTAALRGVPSLSAFEPVAGYGWGVIAEQPSDDAFVSRRRALRSVLFMGSIVLLLATLAACVVVSGLETLRGAAARREELARAQAELDQLKLFTFVASHDLQEPLHKLTLFAGLLTREHGAALGDAGRERLETLVHAADRMRRLVEQMLELARVATRAGTLAPVPLDDVLRTVREDLAAETVAAGARIDVEPLPVVLADRAQMETLFRNLVGNAIKFHPPGEAPRVRVSGVRHDGGTCEIAVADRGIGFEEEYGAKIFEPFQRLHARHRYPGSGLGLAICSRIVQRHGGTLRARSVPGEGSTFAVALPAAPVEGVASGGAR